MYTMPKFIDKQSKCPSSTQNQSTLKLVDLDICKKGPCVTLVGKKTKLTNCVK